MRNLVMYQYVFNILGLIYDYMSLILLCFFIIFCYHIITHYIYLNMPLVISTLKTYKNIFLPEYYKTNLHSSSFLSTTAHPFLQKLILPSTFLLQIASGLIIVTSAMFGPVSIVVPVRVGSQLLFNMFMFDVFSVVILAYTSGI